MPSTFNIYATMQWALAYIDFQPMTIGGNDPALTAALMTLETILGPPFAWRWNRSTANFTCTTGEQDYTVLIPDFGFAEKCSVYTTLYGDKEITKMRVLALDGSNPDRPANFSEQYDDGQGNITFRISPPPDQAYVATVDYQRRPPAVLSLASTWSPIPDQYLYIYNWGFLTMAAMLTGDPRMPMYSQKFVGHLLSAQSGLTESEINIFMSAYLQRTGQVQVASLTAGQGVQSRTL